MTSGFQRWLLSMTWPSSVVISISTKSPGCDGWAGSRLASSLLNSGDCGNVTRESSNDYLHWPTDSCKNKTCSVLSRALSVGVRPFRASLPMRQGAEYGRRDTLLGGKDALKGRTPKLRARPNTGQASPLNQTQSHIYSAKARHFGQRSLIFSAA